MLTRLAIAAIASLILVGALTLPATAHDPPAPQTIQLKEGGQFLHWHSPATPVATVFHDVTIVWRWDDRAWSHSYIPGISPSFDLEADDFLWVVSPRARRSHPPAGPAFRGGSRSRRLHRVRPI